MWLTLTLRKTTNDLIGHFNFTSRLKAEITSFQETFYLKRDVKFERHNSFINSFWRRMLLLWKLSSWINMIKYIYSSTHEYYNRILFTQSFSLTFLFSFACNSFELFLIWILFYGFTTREEQQKKGLFLSLCYLSFTGNLEIGLYSKNSTIHYKNQIPFVLFSIHISLTQLSTSY